MLPSTSTPHADAAIARRSFERCRRVHRLDPGCASLPGRLSQTELGHQQEAIEEALGDAARTIREMASIVEPSKCVFLVASTDGVVVQRYGVGASVHLLGSALDAGSIWTECSVGNNAVGTALVEGQAVTLHGHDHLLQILHPYSCTAVPLLDGESRVCAVLDLTTLAAEGTNTAFLRHALERAALSVHLSLFARARGDCTLVELTEGPPDPLQRSRAMLAVAGDGTVTGMTQPASRLLGHVDSGRLADQLGCDLGALANAPMGSTSTASRWSLRVARTPRTASGGRISRPARPATRSAPLDLDMLSGHDETLRRHRKAVRRILDTELPIMLGGETGTGKDAFAKAIHAASRRTDAAFVAVNCASLPEGLLDSELFGYAPGTFTGGLRDGKRGKIEAADGGTLFLDEIGDMPLGLQGRLLRVLAEREVTRLGAIDPVPVDIQLITATHLDLGDLVAAGRFREDLYYRLRGASFVLPPLRERSDLAELIRRLTPAPLSYDPAALERLLGYRWPGNIRQLKQVIAFTAACADTNVITVADLPSELRDHEHEPAASLGSARQATERDVLVRALTDAAWNVSRAARALGIGRSTAHRKMRQYGIRRPRD